MVTAAPGNFCLKLMCLVSIPIVSSTLYIETGLKYVTGHTDCYGKRSSPNATSYNWYLFANRCRHNFSNSISQSAPLLIFTPNRPIPNQHRCKVPHQYFLVFKHSRPLLIFGGRLQNPCRHNLYMSTLRFVSKLKSWRQRFCNLQIVVARICSTSRNYDDNDL